MLDTRYLYDLHPTADEQTQGWLILGWLDLLRYLILFCAGGFALVFSSLNAWSLPTISELLPSNEQLEIVVNKSSLVKLNQPVKRVSIVAPEIADVQIIDCKQILLTALSVGETTLLIWMEDGGLRTIDVIVRVNTRSIIEALSYTMPDEAIEVVPMNDGVALQGQVHGVNQADRAMKIANTYNANVVNLMNSPGIHQVMLKVRIAEVARTFREEIGVNFQVLDNSFQGTSLLGGLVSGGNVNQPDLTVSDAVTMFMGLPNSNINAFVQALEQKGMLHILAEPNLVARSGETASFLAGGEFPVPIVQGGTSNAITIDYKEFGVRLTFTPTVMDGNKIHLDIAPEVSDLDFAQGVRISGFLVPTIITRRVQTVVSLRDGQSFAIAGLLSKNKQKRRRKVPVIGSIPVFGGLFRGGDITEKETELLIMVTPHLVAPLESDAPYKLPGDSLENAEPNPFIDEEIPTIYPQNIQETSNITPKPSSVKKSRASSKSWFNKKKVSSDAASIKQKPTEEITENIQPIMIPEIISEDLSGETDNKSPSKKFTPDALHTEISHNSFLEPGFLEPDFQKPGMTKPGMTQMHDSTYQSPNHIATINNVDKFGSSRTIPVIQNNQIDKIVRQQITMPIKVEMNAATSVLSIEKNLIAISHPE